MSIWSYGVSASRQAFLGGVTAAAFTAALVAPILVPDASAQQSLGEVAKKETARRKDVEKTAKVYTNGDLRGAPTPSAARPAAPATTPPSAPATTAPAADGTPDSSAGQKPDAKAPAPGPKSDEATWRGRRQSIQESLDRSKVFADALQSRINGLTADFAARDDPAQRSAVAGDRQKSLTELERVKKEVQQYTKELADLLEEGRKSGVPAGWLR